MTTKATTTRKKKEPSVKFAEYNRTDVTMGDKHIGVRVVQHPPAAGSTVPRLFVDVREWFSKDQQHTVWTRNGLVLNRQATVDLIAALQENLAVAEQTSAAIKKEHASLLGALNGPEVCPPPEGPPKATSASRGRQKATQAVSRRVTAKPAKTAAQLKKPKPTGGRRRG